MEHDGRCRLVPMLAMGAMLVRRDFVVRCIEALVLGWLVLVLSGCMLISGAQTSTDAQPIGGNTSVSFVGAEGFREYTLQTGAVKATMNVIILMTLQEGELQLELLDPEGSVVMVVRGRPDQSISRSGTIVTDDRGDLRYRVVARGARNGMFQVLYQAVDQ